MTTNALTVSLTWGPASEALRMEEHQTQLRKRCRSATSLADDLRPSFHALERQLDHIIDRLDVTQEPFPSISLDFDNDAQVVDVDLLAPTATSSPAKRRKVLCATIEDDNHGISKGNSSPTLRRSKAFSSHLNTMRVSSYSNCECAASSFNNKWDDFLHILPSATNRHLPGKARNSPTLYHQNDFSTIKYSAQPVYSARTLSLLS